MRLFESRKVGSMAPATGIIVYGILSLWTFIVFFPLYWSWSTSLKLPIDVANGPFYVPFFDFQPSLHAWRYLFVDVAHDTFRPYFNSLIIATCSTALAIAISSMAAYALTRIQYRPSIGSVVLFILAVAAVVVAAWIYRVDWRIAAAAAIVVFVLAVRALSPRFKTRLSNADILFWIISQRILPPVVAALPIYVMFQQLGLLDTRFALIVTYMTVNLPIVVWLMYDFFTGIPQELEESASLDGASRYRIFFEIVLPLAKPGLVATALLVLILAWNEYLLALFLSTAKAQTMPILVAAQNATRGRNGGTCRSSSSS